MKIEVEVAESKVQYSTKQTKKTIESDKQMIFGAGRKVEHTQKFDYIFPCLVSFGANR